LPMGVIPRPLYCPGRVAAAYTNYLGLPSRWQRTQNGHPRQSKFPHPCSSAWPDRARERPKAGDRARGVSTRSRQNSEGCPRGLGRSLPGRINRNRVVLFETLPAVSVLAPAPAAAGRGGRGNRRDSSECFAPSVRARGPNLLAEVLFTVYCILCAKPGIPTRRFRQT
jgi:hypothetical protein